MACNGQLYVHVVVGTKSCTCGGGYIAVLKRIVGCNIQFAMLIKRLVMCCTSDQDHYTVIIHLVCTNCW